MRRLALLALPLALAGCQPAPVLCFVSGSDQFDEPFPPRTVIARTRSSGGCVVVLDETFYVLPEGEATAATLVPEGETARLTLTGVRFGDDGSQSRLTLTGLVPLPLALPADLSEASATVRMGEPGQPVEEVAVPVRLLRLESAGDGRVTGLAELREGMDSVRFDAPAGIALP